MTMIRDVKTIALRVVLLPRELQGRETESIFSLLKDSGYFENFNEISEELFRDILSQNEDCVQDWLGFSNNKRSDAGWFFLKEGNATYVVGYLSRESKKNKRFVYNNSIDACASFVKREIEQIRTEV